MEKKLEEKLIKKAPIFCRHHDSFNEEDVLTWDFECGNGWYWPLVKCFERIEELNVFYKAFGWEVICLGVNERDGCCHIIYDIVTSVKLKPFRLIHITPEDLLNYKANLYRLSNTFILMVLNRLIDKINRYFNKDKKVKDFCINDFYKQVDEILSDLSNDSFNVCYVCGVSTATKNPLVLKDGSKKICRKCNGDL